MNVRRGAFRLWIVLAGLCAIGWATAVGFTLVDDHLPPISYAFDQPDGPMRRITKSEALDLGNHYREANLPYGVTFYTHPRVDIATPYFSALYEGLKQSRVKVIREKQVERIITATAVALAIPTIVLALGAAFGWALAGFKRE